MRYELARFRARRAVSHSVYDVVETRLEHAQKILARGALLLVRTLVVIAKLLFEHAIDAAYLLLLTKLHGEVRKTLATGAMHAGRGFSLALRFKRTNTTRKHEVGALTTSELQTRTGIAGHPYLL